MAFPRVEAALRSASQPGPGAAQARVWLAVGLLTAAAAALRLYRMGDWSFWVDEMFTLRDALEPRFLYHGMTYPLSYVLIGASLHTLGVSEWSARFVPALFGIAAPAMLYLLARRSFGEVPSVLAAAILAISPWHLYWSQMARFYTMTLFFSSASLLALHRGLEENKRAYAAAAGLLTALAVISHYSALLILAAAAAYAVLLRLLKWQRPPGLNLANVLIFLAPLILGAIVLGSRAGALLSRYLGGAQTGTTFANPLAGAAYMVASIAYRLELPIALLALVGAWLGISRRDRGTLILTCAVAIPALLLVAAGAMSHAENRYAFVVLPPAALLAGSALYSICVPLWERSRLLAFVVPLAVSLPLLQHDLSYFGSFSNGERWNYRAAAQFLRSRARPGDIVYSTMFLPIRHYLRDTGLTVENLGAGADPGRLPGRRSWFVIEDATRGESASRRFAGWLEANCRLSAHFPACSPAADYGLSVYERGAANER